MEHLISSCCAAPPRLYDDNSDTVDHGICPKCRDHCTYLTESEYEAELEKVEILAPHYKIDTNEH